MGRCGREISPDRWYRVIARRVGAQPWDVVLVASAPTIGRAQRLGAVAATLGELQGHEIWVERCYRATESIVIGTTGPSADGPVERDGGQAGS
jgi:hypothetical protein